CASGCKTKDRAAIRSVDISREVRTDLICSGHSVGAGMRGLERGFLIYARFHRASAILPAQPDTSGAAQAIPGFEMPVQNLRHTAAMKRRSDHEQSNVPNTYGEKVRDHVRHSD